MGMTTYYGYRSSILWVSYGSPMGLLWVSYGSPWSSDDLMQQTPLSNELMVITTIEASKNTSLGPRTQGTPKERSPLVSLKTY
jgi:hypothetical protein